jgi:hypothetical protein
VSSLLDLQKPDGDDDTPAPDRSDVTAAAAWARSRGYPIDETAACRSSCCAPTAGCTAADPAPAGPTVTA